MSGSCFSEIFSIFCKKKTRVVIKRSCFLVTPFHPELLPKVSAFYCNSPKPFCCAETLKYLEALESVCEQKYTTLPSGNNCVFKGGTSSLSDLHVSVQTHGSRLDEPSASISHLSLFWSCVHVQPSRCRWKRLIWESVWETRFLPLGTGAASLQHTVNIILYILKRQTGLWSQDRFGFFNSGTINCRVDLHPAVIYLSSSSVVL